MNRAGLMSAITVGTIVGLIFAIFPRLDLEISGLFFNPAGRQFILPGPWIWPVVLRDISMWIVAAVATTAAIAQAVKWLASNTRGLVGARPLVFLLASLVLAPGVMANVVLKEHWDRPRPIQVREFGGPAQFVPWWDPRGECRHNCSFVAGEPSAAFWTLAPAALAPAPLRPLTYAAALAFGAGVGTLRMAFGGHFFTDVVLSGVFTFLIVWLLHGALYRVPAWLIRDPPIERAVETAATTVRTGSAGASDASAPRPQGLTTPETGRKLAALRRHGLRL